MPLVLGVLAGVVCHRRAPIAAGGMWGQGQGLLMGQPEADCRLRLAGTCIAVQQALDCCWVWQQLLLEQVYVQVRLCLLQYPGHLQVRPAGHV